MSSPSASLMHIGLVAARTPDRVAVCSDTGATLLTFGELDRRSRQLALHWRSAGLRHGDHVAILLRNCAEYLVVAWAAQRSGLYYTPLNWHLQEDELRWIIEDCGASAVVVSALDVAMADAVLAANATIRSRIIVGSVVRSDASSYVASATVFDTVDPAAALDEHEGGLMCYSSGTTGRPKGIKRAVGRLPLGTVQPMEYMLRVGYGLDERTVCFNPAPMYHTAPLVWAVATARYGGTVVIADRFDARATLAAVQVTRTTHLQLVPTMMVRIMDLPEAERRAYDLSSLVTLIHSAAPCPPDVKQAMIDWLGPIVDEYYGGTEGIGMCIVHSREWLERPRTVGRAVYGTVHILDDDHNECPVGAVGSIFFSGTPPFEYHHDPEKTRAAYSKQGWGTYGDFGRLDEAGYLFIEDRRTDLIISGGVNIYPRETEEVLMTHTAVFDAAVIGVPHKEFGQEVLGVVQLHAGHDASPQMAAALIEFTRSKLAHLKCPRRIVFQVLPRTPTGKLLRRELRAQHSQTPPSV